MMMCFNSVPPWLTFLGFIAAERDCDPGALMLTSLLFFVLLAVAFVAIYGK